MVKNENEKYKEQCENMYKNGTFCKLRYEKQMEYLFSKLEYDFKDQKLNVLDACCGYGRLIYFLNKFNNKQHYTGVDYSKTLINQAKKSFKEFKNISFTVQDIFNLPDKYEKEFDITINYKTLSWLPYYEECIKNLIKVTKNKIYLTSLFNEGSFESITKIYTNSDNYTYLNTYSLPKFKTFVEGCGAKVIDTIPMHLDFDLEKPKDKNEIATYTELLKNDERLEITANTLLNWKLIIIKIC